MKDLWSEPQDDNKGIAEEVRGIRCQNMYIKYLESPTASWETVTLKPAKTVSEVCI